MHPVPINAFSCNSCGVIRSVPLDVKLVEHADFASLNCPLCGVTPHSRVGIELTLSDDSALPLHVGLIAWAARMPDMTEKDYVRWDRARRANFVAPMLRPSEAGNVQCDQCGSMRIAPYDVRLGDPCANGCAKGTYRPIVRWDREPAPAPAQSTQADSDWKRAQKIEAIVKELNTLVERCVREDGLSIDLVASKAIVFDGRSINKIAVDIRRPIKGNARTAR